MAIPEWVEIIGKLGPVSVAAAVFFMNRAQNSWQNRVSARATKVEDEKLRLSLLDRRAQVIDSLDVAASKFHSTGTASEEMIGTIYKALKIAELVYDDHEERTIHELLAIIAKWRQTDRMRVLWLERDEEKANRAIDELVELEDVLLKQLMAVRLTLIQATKVRAVPPIVVTPIVRIRLPWFRRTSELGKNAS